MKRHSVFLMQLLLLFALTSCDKILSRHSNFDLKNDGMQISSMTFNEDYSKITLYATDVTDLGGLQVEDTSEIKIKVSDLNREIIPFATKYYPKLDSVINISVEEIEKNKLIVLVLVDLTQTANVINQQRGIVKRLKSFFRNNLMISFMLPHGMVSQPMLATSYIIDTYTVSGSPLLQSFEMDGVDSLSNRAYLYRSVACILDEVMKPKDSMLIKASHRTVLVLSDGVVYDDNDNVPIDPDHFKVQADLIATARKINDDVVVNYVNLASTDNGDNMKDNNIMRMVCSASGGRYFDSFDINAMKREILKYFNIHINEYKFILKVPEKRIYFGNKCYIKLDLYNKADSLLATGNYGYQLGSVYDPIISGYKINYNAVLFRGLGIFLQIAIMLYILMQFVIPYVCFTLFRRRNVVDYTGTNMSVNGNIIPGSCYFCKAPFVAGDKIVVACEHVTHEECWEENGCHCPEYGAHCHAGGHQYDKHNLLNNANAPFYTKWVLICLVPAIWAWIMIIKSPDYLNVRFLNTLIGVLVSNSEVKDTEDLMAMGTNYVSSREFFLPILTYYLVFGLTFCLSWMTVERRRWYIRLMSLAVRGLVATMVSLAAYALDFIILLTFHLYDGGFFLDWIPLTMIVFAICFCSTYRTLIHIHTKKMALYSLVAGVVLSMIFQYFSLISVCDDLLSAILLLLLIVAAILVIVVRPIPNGNHYSLHVTGPVKEMDIALFKWLRQSPDAVVTIGRSVDCSLQLTWDIQSDIAPMQASIFMKKSRPHLLAEDDIVLYNGKPLENGKPKALYHGDTFKIGMTEFRFVDL